MGIQGLLPMLKSIMVPMHIKELEGCCVAVDTYSWLHKGALSCSKELCKGQPTSKHIVYCMHRVNLLRHYGVRPILVFDGGLLPMKIEQENKRARARKENLARAIEHESNGNAATAYECYQKAVDISPKVAYELIQVLKQENVYYIVAPYEADAQMTFLAVSKQVDAVITEDSDLIAFGCPRIIYKMDKFGQSIEFQYSKLQQNKELNFTGFTKQMLLEMCILSGCDYLQSLPGLGLKKAHALVKKFKSYDKVIKHLRYSTVAVSPGYEESFKKAILTFQHQRVYDPTIEDIVHLSCLPDNTLNDLDFLGPLIPQRIAKGIARGDLDPFTKMPFEEVNRNTGSAVDGTYELKNFNPERRKLELPAQRNLLTNYFCFASLEAKRKYKVPRDMPKHQSQMRETSSPVEHVTKEDAACKSNCTAGSLLDSEYQGMPSPIENCAGNGVVAESPRTSESPIHGLCDKKDTMADKRNPHDLLLQQSWHSIHKPCIKSHKEQEEKSSLDGNEGKMSMEHPNVILESSYFQHKSAKGSVLVNQNEMLVEKNYITMDKRENTVYECEYKASSGASEGETRMKNRKTTVRSSYFLPKLVNGNDQGSKNTKLSVYNPSTVMCEHAIPESTSDNKYTSSSIMKRKVPSVDSDQIEKMNYKCVRTNASLSTQSACSFTPDDTVIEANAKSGKFGCNISHLEKYSDIAEKSMERFVSVMSSFRFSSSGSRASGLRAPLKDVQNTFTSRSTAGVDFNKFAYVPTKRKTSSAYPRG
ncbi:exonuclease 1 [Diospyros lotus]|uniref:exonuclease 1 n=1 Tax=Diospyros lotus TaxID=55363 RepID=UPI00225810CE|nr:exonuclease 1 [Diospyros lotus]